MLATVILKKRENNNGSIKNHDVKRQMVVLKFVFGLFIKKIPLILV